MATVSHILLKWLVILDFKLKPLIKWPEHEGLWLSTLACSSFGKVIVIIDHFEVFSKRASSVMFVFNRDFRYVRIYVAVHQVLCACSIVHY